MSVTLINDCVLLPYQANWRSLPKGSRRWTDGIGTSQTGAEDRTGFRSRALHRIDYGITLAKVEDRSLLEARVMAALKSGRAAVPFFGRGLELTSAVGSAWAVNTQLTVTTLDWFIVFQDPPATSASPAFKVFQISGITQGGGTASFTVSALPSFTVVAGQFFYRLFFGKPAFRDLQTLSDEMADLAVTVSEPLGTGSLLHASTSCPADPGTPAAGPLSFCEGDLVLSLAAVQGCAALESTIEWTAVPYAQLYKEYHGTSPGGPYSYYGITFAPTLTKTVSRNLLGVPKYVVVTSLIGGKESAYSNEITVPAITLESVMRAMQERWALCVIGVPGFGPMAWPARTYPSAGSPGDYPADGFYDADIATIGVSQLVYLVQTISDYYFAAFLTRYATTDNWAGLASPPLHSTATLPPITVTSGNVNTSFQTLRSYICELNFFTLAATQDDAEKKQSSAIRGNYPTDSDPGAQASVLSCVKTNHTTTTWGNWDRYGGYNYTAFVNGVGCVLYDSAGISIDAIGASIDSSWQYFGAYALYGYGALAVNVRGKIAADLTDYGAARALVMVKLSGHHPTLLNNWRYWVEASAGTNWVSGYFTASETTIDLPGPAGNDVWTLLDQMVLLDKTAFWTHNV